MNEEKLEETKEENKRLPIVANGRGLVLRSMDDMWRFACAVTESGIAPSSFTKPEQILIAIQSGAELGMPPMRSLQSYCVINGSARLWGDAPLALVRQSSLLEYIKESIEGEGDDMVAICETKRKGDLEPVITEFSVDDAKQAGLWGKKGTWQNYPKRMLKYRARSFNLRDNFPDCFGGSTIAEEYEGLPTPEPSHETTTPKRKPIESEQTETKPDETPLIKTAILGVYEIFEQKVGQEDASVEKFAEISAAVCGGVKDDYWKFDDDVDPALMPEAYTMEKLVKIKDSFADEPQTQPEVLDDFKYICNNKKCGIRFNEPTENDLCPECLSKEISIVEEVDAK